MTKKSTKSWLIILCFAIVYIVWGSTYLANEYAIDAIPPWLMAGIRFTIAGLLLLGISYSWKWKKPTLRQWRNSWIIGLLLMTLGIGGTVWGQQFIDSGITSLLIGTNPLVVLFLVWLINKKRPKPIGVLGVITGLLGMYLLVSQTEITAQDNAIAGIGMILFCVFCWALGAVIIPKMDLPKIEMQSAAMQMTLGGLTLLLISGLSGEFNDIHLQDIRWQSWVAWAYLIIFGSIIAYTAFNYLLAHVSPEQVSTIAYVNPVIAVFLGWFFRDEIITQQTGFAAALMLVGVFFINKANKG